MSGKITDTVFQFKKKINIRLFKYRYVNDQELIIFS